jgi:hypothetical protein
MKVGDLVKMDFENDDEFHPDEWGVGVIVEMEGEDPMGCDNVHVLWVEVGLSWEMLAMLEKVDE